MRAAFATLVFAGLAVANPVANPVPQGVTSAIAPSGTPPAGCYANYKGSFLIGPRNVTSSSGKRDLEFELDERNTKLGISLNNGILTDPLGRTGYIAANQQFQFDGPPQTGAILTAGFYVCDDKRLYLGSDDIWWACLSGGFRNLYYKTQGGQCIKSYLITFPENAGDGPVAGPGTTTVAITATAGTTTAGTSTGSANGTITTHTVSGGGAGNATATTTTAVVMSSGAASNSSTTVVITGSSTTATTVVGIGHGATTITAGGETTVVGGQQHKTTTKAGTTAGGAKTTGGGGGSPTSTGSAASSSSSPAAAPLATLRSEMFGLAAGVLALVAL